MARSQKSESRTGRASDRGRAPAGKPVQFDALLERMDNNLGWVIARVPMELGAIWGKRGQVRVTGDINGFPLRTSLFPAGNGSHFLLVNKAMQKGGRVASGMSARFRLEQDRAERKTDVPSELADVLAEERQLRRYYDALNNSMRNDIARFVLQAKSPAARRRRAERIAERLMTAMLGEQGELPPILQAAFRQNAAARAGWEKMGRSARRSHLLGLTAYVSPESRAKRLAKTIEAAMQRAKRSPES